MPTTAADSGPAIAKTKAKARVEVAVGILSKATGELLVQQRRQGTDCAGQWEFPGGKLEADESPLGALARELREELSIEIDLASCEPLTVLEHDYSHAKVRLHTYRITRWSGEPQGTEGQTIVWADPSEILKLDLLEAAYPLLKLVTRNPAKS